MRNSNSELPANSRILLTRTSHIGDCILTLPMLCALRERYPQAFIAWAVERPSDQFLAKHACLDEVIPLRRGWLKSLRAIRELRSTLHAMEFDVAVDSQSRTRSSLSAWLSGAPRRIGWRHPHGKDIALLVNNERHVSKATHLVDRQLDLLRAVGIEQPRVRFDFPIDLTAERKMEDFVTHGLNGRRFVVFNPGAGWESRRWPTDRYAAVAQHLRERYNLVAVVAWAGDSELALANEIVQWSAGAAVAAPQTSLLELAALLRRAAFYFGSDTGPMHFAVAVGLPCVGLFGPTRPECSGPYGAGHVAVQAYYQGGGGMFRRNAGNQAMQAISIDMACNGCDTLVTQLGSAFSKQPASRSMLQH